MASLASSVSLMVSSRCDKRVAQRLRLRGEIADRVLAPLRQHLAGREHADPQEIRPGVLAREQHLEVLRASAAADIRSTPPRRRPRRRPARCSGRDRRRPRRASRRRLERLNFAKRDAREHVGKRAGRGDRDGLALEVLDRADAVLDHEAVRHDRPMAADDLDVGAAHVGRDRRLGRRPRSCRARRPSSALSPIWSSFTSSSSSLRPSRSAKPRLAAISRKPASDFGAMIPWRQGLALCAPAGATATAAINTRRRNAARQACRESPKS